MSHQYLYEEHVYAPSTLPLTLRAFEYDGRDSNMPFPAAVVVHNHKAAELIYVTDGTLEAKSGSSTYFLSAGDVILFNPYEVHTMHFEKSKVQKNRYICLTLPLNKLFSFTSTALYGEQEKLLGEISKFDTFYSHTTADGAELAGIISAMYDIYFTKAPSTEALILSYLYKLIVILFEGHYHNKGYSESTTQDTQFIIKISNYLRTHYMENITTAEIAKIFFMSDSQFCHKFKKNFGLSFLKYLRQFRINKATELYKDSSLSISEIAAAVGFEGYCYFSKCFREYIGVPPSEFFKPGKRL